MQDHAVHMFEFIPIAGVLLSSVIARLEEYHVLQPAGPLTFCVRVTSAIYSGMPELTSNGIQLIKVCALLGRFDKPPSSKMSLLDWMKIMSPRFVSSPGTNAIRHADYLWAGPSMVIKCYS